MIVSTKGRYALRVMIDMAQHHETEYLPLREIADRQGISEKYLESIIKILVQHKLVTGVRGKNGGYKLTREPKDYTAWDIISITENDLYVVSCLNPGADACDRINDCTTLPMWKEFNETLQNFFRKYTIEELAEHR